jgi:N-acetylneuraminic acid mutarotase
MGGITVTRTCLYVLISLFVFMMLHGSARAQHEGTVVIDWVRGPDVPLPRGGYFAAWYENGLWIGGGSYWKDGMKLWTDETSFYDPKKNAWSILEPIPQRIGYGVTAVIGKDLYLLGGVDADSNLNRDIYKLHAGQWRKIGKSPAGFAYPAFATIGPKIYVFGGSASATDVTKATNDAWVYNAKTGEWSKLEAIPGPPRQIFSGTALGAKIYVFGGVTQKTGEKIANLDDAFCLDTKTGKWTRIKKLPQPMRAFWAQSDGKSIYLIGGYNEGGLDSVYRYSPLSDSYELVSTLPQPLMDTKFLYHNGRFFGASGEDKLASRFAGLVIGTLDENPPQNGVTR